MIRGESWYMVRELLREGLALSEIARRTGLDRTTLRRIRDAPSHPPSPRRPRTRLVDPYVPYLQQRLAAGVTNATKILSQ